MLIITYILLNAAMQAYGREQVKTGSEFYEMAKVVLELQMTHCDYVPVCIVNVSAYSKNKLPYDNCCQSCSCESDCKQSYSCCPDYWFRDIIPDVIFDDVDADHVMDTLKNNSWEIPSDSERDHVTETLDASEECVSSRLRTRGVSQNIIGIHKAYVMVSKCPTNYGKDKKELNIKKQCEFRANIGDFLVDQDLDLSADTVIPWSSRKSGVTYRNVYCLQCNEGVRGGIPWSSWFTCLGNDKKNAVSFIQNVLEKPVSIFRRITRLSFCNIIFEPPRFAKNLKLTKCNYADVKTCSNDWIAATNDTAKVAVYEKICSNFYSPVTAGIARNRAIYYNIVCRMCNTAEGEYTACSRFVKDSPRVELNTHTITRSAATGTSSGLLPLNILTNDTSPCTNGSIFDTNDNTCRMIYCPGNFFNDNGTCVPKILHTDGFYYSIKLVVTAENETLLMETEVELFESNVYTFLDRLMLDNFANFSIKMWRLTVNGTIKHHLIYISFSNEKDTYVDTIWLLRKALQNMSTFEVQTDQRILPLTVRFLKYDVFSINTLERDSSVANDIFDRSQRRRLKLVHETATTNFTSMSQLQISRTHLCFRTLISQRDVQVYRRGIAKIRRTNITLQGTDFEINYNGSFVYVCIEDFLNVKVNARTWWKQVFPPIPVASREPDDERTPLLPIIVSALFGGGLVLCMAIVYKCMQRSGVSDN